MADRPAVQRTLHVEYLFDRLWAEKLVQAYELLLPDKRWPAASERANRQQTGEVVNEKIGRPVRTRVI